MISGTNGLLGAADGAFILYKDKRTSNTATLEISGRDQQEQKLILVKNSETLYWELQSKETELWKEPPEPLLEAIAEFITAENTDWAGTATELLEKTNLSIPVNSITKRMNVNASCYLTSRLRKIKSVQKRFEKPKNAAKMAL